MESCSFHRTEDSVETITQIGDWKSSKSLLQVPVGKDCPFSATHSEHLGSNKVTILKSENPSWVPNKLRSKEPHMESVQSKLGSPLVKSLLSKRALERKAEQKKCSEK